MNIPAHVVMSITGHNDYENMKPYFETADSTAMHEMAKWNDQNTQSEIISFLDGLNDKQLKKVLQFVKTL